MIQVIDHSYRALKKTNSLQDSEWSTTPAPNGGKDDFFCDSGKQMLRSIKWALASFKEITKMFSFFFFNNSHLYTGL